MCVVFERSFDVHVIEERFEMMEKEEKRHDVQAKKEEKRNKATGKRQREEVGREE